MEIRLNDDFLASHEDGLQNPYEQQLSSHKIIETHEKMKIVTYKLFWGIRNVLKVAEPKT